jgi:hypothetical protein
MSRNKEAQALPKQNLHFWVFLSGYLDDGLLPAAEGVKLRLSCPHEVGDAGAVSRMA